jgi:hypothetical protein
MKEYRGVEYAVVQGIERGVWKWSASVEGMIVAGNEQTRPAAVIAAEKAIDGRSQDGPARPSSPINGRHRTMTNGDKQPTSDVLQILHGARSLPPVEAAEALKPFLESMRKSGSDDALASASIAAVTELARSLKENHAASNDLWQEAIEATLSYANEASSQPPRGIRGDL